MMKKPRQSLCIALVQTRGDMELPLVSTTNSRICHIVRGGW